MSGDRSRSGTQHSFSSNERAGMTVLVKALGRCHQQHKPYAMVSTGTGLKCWQAERVDRIKRVSSNIVIAVWW